MADDKGKGGGKNKGGEKPRLDLSSSGDALDSVFGNEGEGEKGEEEKGEIRRPARPPLPDFDAPNGGTNGKEGSLPSKKTKTDPEKDELAQRIKTLESERDDLRTKVEELSRRNLVLEEDLHSAQEMKKEQSGDKDKKIEELKGKLEDLNSKYNAQVLGGNTLDELERLKGENTALEAENEKLKTKVGELTHDVEEANKARETIREKAKTEVGRLMKELEAAKAGKPGGKSDDKALEKIEELKKRLATAEDNLEKARIDELTQICKMIGRDPVPDRIDEIRVCIMDWVEKHAGPARGDGAKERPAGPKPDEETDAAGEGSGLIKTIKDFVRVLFS